MILAVILIQACKDSSSGPTTEAPVEIQITSIQPESGTAGTEVIITGSGFKPEPTQNKVIFNGIESIVDSATTTQLFTIVPEEASTGLIEVTVDGISAKGPEFEIITTGVLEIHISTTRPELEPDGFDILVNGEIKKKAEPKGITLLEFDEGVYDIELSDMINFCEITGENIQSVEITVGSTTEITYEVECQAILNDQIVYLRYENGADLFVMNSDGSNRLQLTTDKKGSNMPAISPDGTKIAFVRDNDIYVMNADGSNVTNLTSSAESDQDPDWSPDGNKIVFSRSGLNKNREIVTINADGTGITPLTDATYDHDVSPSWSPDGQKIVFIRLIGLNRKIFTMNSDGNAQQPLNDSISSDAFDVIWSPNGEEIAFIGRKSESVEIFIIDSDGTNKKAITGKLPDIDNPLAWSPDGTKLLYYALL